LNIKKLRKLLKYDILEKYFENNNIEKGIYDYDIEETNLWI
jgi:hypothetical protein